MAYGKSGKHFINQPALHLTARELAGESPSLLGRNLGPYQILALIGAGGMGEVYKARDSKLNRSVAIKVLPTDKTSDADRKHRFVQEARAASALNHPNIITIHDIRSEDGVDFVVMEHVAGTALDRLIPRRGLKLNEVLKYSIPLEKVSQLPRRPELSSVSTRDLPRIPQALKLTNRTGFAVLADHSVPFALPVSQGQRYILGKR